MAYSKPKAKTPTRVIPRLTQKFRQIKTSNPVNKVASSVMSNLGFIESERHSDGDGNEMAELSSDVFDDLDSKVMVAESDEDIARDS